MAEISVEATRLTVDNETLEFGAPVTEHLEYDEFVVIRLKVIRETYPNKLRNVIAVNHSGSIRWKLPEQPQSNPRPYTSIFIKNDGSMWAYNSCGMQYQIDPDSGEIVDNEWRK